MKYAIIIPDGAADEPLKELGGKTPLEAAETPNMDRVATEGRQGLVRTGPGGVESGSGGAGREGSGGEEGPGGAAETPNMGRVGTEGRQGLVRTVPEGFESGSDVATMTLPGYE